MDAPTRGPGTTVTANVNGQRRELPAGTTLGALVDQLAGRRAGVAVALNRQVVPRAAWDATPVGPDDQVELLSAVAGG